MASTPYSVGTITVVNGSTSVAGTDTFWIGAANANDMLFIPSQGRQARITADPTDNEVLAITAWSGTDLTDADYEIIPAADSTTSSARLRDLLAQMSAIEANGRGLFYRFSDSVTDEDPGAGYLRLNTATIGSATAAYLDNLDANGATVSAVLDSWDDEATPAARGQLWLRSVADPSAFHAFKVSGSIVDGTGYRKLTLAYIGGSSTFAADDEMMVMFSAQGADGTNAILGVWQGAWVTATAYGVDDLVEESGSTYICIEAHTSGTFATDLAADKWDLAVEKGETGGTGDQGDKGWSPQIAVVNDGTRRVHQLAGYVGGAGTAPTANVGEYLKGDGTFTATIGDAADVRGPAGLNGAGTVASVEAGVGIAVDNTDPTAPVVSAEVTTGKAIAMAIVFG